MNRNLGHESGKVARELSSAMADFEKRYDRGVSEIKDAYQGKMTAFENYTRKKILEEEDKIYEYEFNREAAITSTYSTTDERNKYNSYAKERLEYDRRLDSIKRSSLSVTDKAQKIAELDQLFDNKLKSLNISNADRTQMDSLFVQYDKLIDDSKRRNSALEQSIKDRRKEIAKESKREQYNKRAENMLDPAFEQGRIEWARDAYDFFRERENKLSAEVLENAFEASFKKNDDGEGIIAQNFDQLNDYIKDGMYLKKVLDDSGNLVTQQVKLDGDFLMQYDNLMKNLGYVADNNDSGIKKGTPSGGKKDDKK